MHTGPSASNAALAPIGADAAVAPPAAVTSPVLPPEDTEFSEPRATVDFSMIVPRRGFYAATLEI